MASGWGAGGRNPARYANALRIVLAGPAGEPATVVMLATDLDDLSPEYLEPLREALFEAGALDVQIWSTQAKKGRVGFRLEAACPHEGADRVGEALFRHSTTAGWRRWTAERVTLVRRQVSVDGGSGTPVRVKILEAPDGPRAKPEYDDVTALARAQGRPAHEVARDLQNRALRLIEAERARATGPQTPNTES
jgi:hypothetical protein